MRAGNVVIPLDPAEYHPPGVLQIDEHLTMDAFAFERRMEAFLSGVLIA